MVRTTKTKEEKTLPTKKGRVYTFYLFLTYLYGALVVVLRGTDKGVVRRVQQLEQVAKVGRHAVDELPRFDSESGRRLLDFLPVFVRTGQEENVPTRQAHVPGNDVAG